MKLNSNPEVSALQMLLTSAMDKEQVRNMVESYIKKALTEFCSYTATYSENEDTDYVVDRLYKLTTADSDWHKRYDDLEGGPMYEYYDALMACDEFYDGYAPFTVLIGPAYDEVLSIEVILKHYEFVFEIWDNILLSNVEYNKREIKSFCVYRPSKNFSCIDRLIRFYDEPKDPRLTDIDMEIIFKNGFMSHYEYHLQLFETTVAMSTHGLDKIDSTVAVEFGPGDGLYDALVYVEVFNHTLRDDVYCIRPIVEWNLATENPDFTLSEGQCVLVLKQLRFIQDNFKSIQEALYTSIIVFSEASNETAGSVGTLVPNLRLVACATEQGFYYEQETKLCHWDELRIDVSIPSIAVINVPINLTNLVHGTYTLYCGDVAYDMVITDGMGAYLILTHHQIQTWKHGPLSLRYFKKELNNGTIN